MRSPKSRYFTYFVLALLVLWRVLGALPAAAPSYFWDSFWYERLAQSISQGAYSLDGLTLHRKYPPGLPLTTWLLSFGTGSLSRAEVWVPLASMIIATILTFAIAAPLSTPLALIAAALFTLHHLAYIHSQLLGSEGLFTALTLAALFLSRAATNSLPRLAACALCAGLAALVRYEGFLLIAVLALTLGPLSIQKRLGFFLLSALPSAPWAYVLATHAGALNASEYFSELRDLSLLAALDFLSLIPFLGIAFCLLALFRLRLTLRALGTSVTGWVIAYFLVHAFWWWSDSRFFVPLLPFICIAAANAICCLLQRIENFGVRLLVTGPLVMLLGYEQFSLLVPREYEPRRYNVLYLSQYEPVREAAEWLASTSPIGLVIVPDVAVYSHFLPAWTLVSLDDLSASPEKALDRSRPVYLIWDNIHFKSEAVQSALKGQALYIVGPEQRRLELHLAVRYQAEQRSVPGDPRSVSVVEVVDRTIDNS